MQNDIGGIKQLALWAIATLRPEKKRVAIVCILVLGNAFLAGMADPVAIKLLIDSLTKHDLHRFLFIVLASVCLYTILRQLGAWIERLTQSIIAAISERFLVGSLTAFYRLPYEEVNRGDTGYFVSRICDESIQVAAVVQLVTQLLQATAIFTAAAAVCLWLSWKTSIILCVMVPILRFAAIRYRKRISDAVVDETEYEARLKEVLGRSVESYKTVRIFNLMGVVENQVRQHLHRFLDAASRQVKYSAAFRALSGTLLSYSEFSVFVATGIAVLKNALSIGGLFGFVNAYSRVVSSIESITSMIPLFASLDAKRKRLDSLLNLSATPVTTENEDGKIHTIFAEGVSITRGDVEVIEKCDMSVSLGERLLLHGPNGSGKTTLAHALSGLLPVRGGALQLPALSRISAMLSPHYFAPGTLEDNLQFSLKTDTDRARLHDLARELGMTLDITQDPSRLSEGEKRKCQILMTLMKEADFYIFDEPLANIDTASSHAVMSSILRHTEDKGLIVIMHGGEEYRLLFGSEVKLSNSRAKMIARSFPENHKEQFTYE